MKSKKLRDAFTYVSDENLDRADTYRKVRNPHWVRWTALAACLCLIVGISLWHPGGNGGSNIESSTGSNTGSSTGSNTGSSTGSNTGSSTGSNIGSSTGSNTGSNTGSMWLVASAAYPETDGGHMDAQEVESLFPFLQTSTARFLSNTGSKNCIYSPLSVYLSLSILAESSAGESREQLLRLLGVDSVETLRVRAGDLWRANYINKDNTSLLSDTSLLSNSLWLDEELCYVKDGVDMLARDYYTSVFQGKIGSTGYNEQLQNWLNETTKGLLTQQAEGIEMDSNTLLALISTVYFDAQWMKQFDAGNNNTKPFTKANGSTEDCIFMNRSFEERFYRGESFDAVGLPLSSGGKMWFLLPQGGSTPEMLAADASLTRLLTDPDGWEDYSKPVIHFSVPKFDLSSELDLIDGLKNLGVTDVFDEAAADFSPILTAGIPVSVSQAKHAVRVSIDEEGVTAASFTNIIVSSGWEEAEVNFVLDRPFLFAITNRDNLPLFLGVVNDPTVK